MNNYIDLTTNKVWTDDQINRRLQSAIRSRVSQEDEMKAARLSRKAKPTAADKAFIKSLDDHVAACLAAIAAVTADNALLRATLAHEQAVALLATPALDPKAVDGNGDLLYPTIKVMNITTGKPTGKTNPHPALVMDTETRKQAAATVKGATKAVKALAKKRVPPKVAPVV